jgi:type I restriction enzyme S subunit
MGEWKEYRLGDYIKVKHGYAFAGKNITTEETDDILVTPGNFNIGGGFKDNKFKYFNGEYPKEYILNHNDIVVTMTDLSKETDTLGYSAKIPNDKSKNFLHNQRIGLLQFKNENIDSEFIYWLLRTREYQGYIVGSASGTSIMHTSPSRIEEYTFNAPELKEEQIAIAEVLSSLDDKIDLLHRQNKTLEELAQTLFRQWFIEEAKVEWEVGTFADLVDVASGKSLKRELFDDNGEYEVLGANGKIGKTNEWLFNEELIYTGRVGTLGNIFLIDEAKKVWLSDNTLVVKPKKYFYFIYFLMIDFQIENLNVGSTQPPVRQSDLKNIEISLPDNELIIKFENQSKNIFSKINENKKQIQTLRNLRDTLLAKLMTGEVRVEN